MSNKKELNKVEREKLLEVVRNAGLTVTEQSAYAKCTAEGSPAKIYVANSKSVTRVDLSGFTTEHAGITQISREDAKQLKLGNVQAQLDFEQTEDVVLEALSTACEALKTVPAPAPKLKKEHKPRVKKTKAKTETTEAPEPETTQAPEPEMSEEELAKRQRLEEIRAAAKRSAAAASA